MVAKHFKVKNGELAPGMVMPLTDEEMEALNGVLNYEPNLSNENKICI